MSAPFLQYPDYTRPFHIATDASNTGVGGVLFQPSVPGEYITATNIVSICSKKLTDSQRRYAAYKKRAMGCGLFTAPVSFRTCGGRGDLVLITDHKPLTYIFSSTQLSPALQQWARCYPGLRFSDHSSRWYLTRPCLINYRVCTRLSTPACSIGVHRN